MVSLKPLQRVLGVTQLGRSVQRNQIVVVNKNQLAQRQRSSQRSSFVRNPFHQVAVAQQRKGVVIHHLKPRLVINRRQVLLRNGHSHRHRDSLTQRPGSYFHAVCVAVLRMPRRPRSPLPEALQVFHRHVIPSEVEHPVQHRRRVPVRQNKAVPVRPFRVLRIVLHQLVKEQVSDGRATQRSAWVAGFSLLHLVHGKQPQCIDGQLVQSHCVESLFCGAGSHISSNEFLSLMCGIRQITLVDRNEPLTRVDRNEPLGAPGPSLLGTWETSKRRGRRPKWRQPSLPHCIQASCHHPANAKSIPAPRLLPQRQYPRYTPRCLSCGLA